MDFFVVIKYKIIDFSLDREDLHDQVNEYIHTLVEKEKAK